MNTTEFFKELRTEEKKLLEMFPDGVIHVTSVRHRERGSTEGTTLSANPYNAARVITEGTHRLATPDEIERFLDLQEANRLEAVKAEQRKNKQYVIVVDDKSPADAGIAPHSPSVRFTQPARRPKASGTAVAEAEEA